MAVREAPNGTFVKLMLAVNAVVLAGAAAGAVNLSNRVSSLEAKVDSLETLMTVQIKNCNDRIDTHVEGHK